MIDPADKQTEALPLEPQKRGRGRPPTGQAMTPAEKQRAYRQRLAEQQKSQVPAVQLEKVRSTAAEYLEKLGQQLADAKAELAKALKRAEEAEADRRAMDAHIATLRGDLKIQAAVIKKLEIEKGNVTESESGELWTVQNKRPGTKKWISSEPETFKSAKDSVDYMQFKSGSGQGSTWRAVRFDGMIYWPKYPK